MIIRVILMLLAFSGKTLAGLEVVQGDGLCSLKWDEKAIVERSDMSNLGYKAIGGSEGVAHFKDFGVVAGKVYYYRLRLNDGFSAEQTCVPGKLKKD